MSNSARIDAVINVRFGLAALLATSVLGALVGCGGSGSPAAPFNRIWGNTVEGTDNGTAAQATFSNPANVVVAADGTVYVADYDSNLIRAISPAGIVSTLVNQLNFSLPFGLTMSKAGDLYCETDADPTGAHDATTGSIWKTNTTSGAATLIAQHLGRPRGLGILSTGMLVCSDLGNSTIYTLNPTTGATTPLAGKSGVAGFANGTGAAAEFARPYGLAVLPNDSILVADQTNNLIRMVTSAGVVTTYAGTGTMGAKNAPNATATFNQPEAVALAPDGTVYIADHDNHLIRKVKNGQVTTEAGNGQQGFVDGIGLSAEFYGLEGIALTTDGRTLWIADGNNGDGTPFNRVRRLHVP